MSKIPLALYVLTTSAGLVFLKLGTSTGLPISFINQRLQLNLNLYTSSGILLYALSFILYLYLIARNDLGYIIPLTASFVYILVFVASYFIFKESFPLTKVLAIGLIIAGLVLLNLNR